MKNFHSRSTASLLVLVSLCFAWDYLPATAQDTAQTSCEALVTEMSRSIRECSDINSNWSCYGRFNADVDPIKFRFHDIEDRKPLKNMNALTTDRQGIVFMRLAVDGEPEDMTAMLFGDARVDANEPGQPNFLLRIDNQANLCSATPPGMVIRTADGKRGKIIINRVIIRLRSSAFITMISDREMSVTNLEGSVSIDADGQVIGIGEGQQVRILFENGRPIPIGLPQPSPYASSILLNHLANDPTGLGAIGNSNANPSDPAACVGTLNFGDSFEEIMTNEGHECVYDLCTDPGQTVTINMDALDPDLDPWIDLRDPSGTLITFNNDIRMNETNSILCNVQLPPKPVGEGCFSVIARSHHNDSFGRFRLSLAGQSACQQADPSCEVMTRGLNLRSSPDASNRENIILTLPQNTHLTPLSPVDNLGWIEVTTGGVTGWVSTDPRFLLCDRLAEIPPCTYYYHDGLPGGDRPSLGPDCDTGNGGTSEPLPPPPPPKSRPLPGQP